MRSLADNAVLRIASGTWQQYNRPIREWVAHCTRVGATPIGAPPAIAAVFLDQRRRAAALRGVGAQAVTRASAAITALHEAAGLPSPCAHPLCAAVRAAARRTLLGQRRTKVAATAEDIQKLVDTHLQPNAPLLTRMVVTCALLSFCAFLRYSDLRRVMVHHQLMQFSAACLTLRLFCGKTDKAAQGEEVTVGRIGGAYCPVTRVEELLRVGRYSTVPSIAQRPMPQAARGRTRWEEIEDTGPLLRAVSTSGALEQITAPLDNPVPSLSWQQYSSLLKQHCLAAGLRHLPPHAFRRGGATAAVAGGASRDAVMKEGRWRTRRVFEFTYVQVIQAAACKVTACLGLRAPPPHAPNQQ
ncbi:hypothetical protein CHLRE_02g093150v5 [Chlamydomonas reinhardtii]|uniref:Tyr recombinase domain-containing protein n=1 Tax=Chlamydomonas reinhardtii TaxID=3055 RepID=A0A2K3E1G6_CHLRE|nr:uncharacterized protein CHLRE_02g093150v5 [Chlamydomonas reinhardtii]XP_042927096.1 uncharacterized protein CHLRE_02g093150v5 [Chlamydomonas reinhardtii]PNW86596.1 hypothetical protein CHLRE_02g093150v5 [Chlamydomonas reinhardtii]PNW86597.1 hypothetical protein CHLRE_02g093150v5 [Chlamydomonas reinhardtii]